MIFYWIEESGIHQRGAFLKIPTAAGGRRTSSDHFAYLLLLPFFTIHREKEKKKASPTEREREREEFYTLLQFTYVGFVSY